MIVYHSTSAAAAEAIESGGFVDGAGTYLTATVHRGVWVSDIPLDGNDHGNFQATVVFAINVPDEDDIDQWEWVEDGKPYREWLLPGAELNRYPRRRVSEAELGDAAIVSWPVGFDRRRNPRPLQYEPETAAFGGVDLVREVWAELAMADHWTADDLDHRLMRVGRVYGPLLLAEAYSAGDLIDDDAVTACVGPVWSMAEFPERALDLDLWRELFDVAGYTVTGEDGIGVSAKRPREPLVLWRGATHAGRLGWSWSSDRRVAERFATQMVRGREAGMLWTAEVAPERLLAYIHDRDEEEYVVDIKGLNVIQVPSPVDPDGPADAEHMLPRSRA